MGEIADMMLDGTMCQCCGAWLHDGDDGFGYPGVCRGCSAQEDLSNVENRKRQRKEHKKVLKAIRNNGILRDESSTEELTIDELIMGLQAMRKKCGNIAVVVKHSTGCKRIIGLHQGDNAVEISHVKV